LKLIIITKERKKIIILTLTLDRRNGFLEYFKLQLKYFKQLQE